MHAPFAFFSAIEMPVYLTPLIDGAMRTLPLAVVALLLAVASTVSVFADDPEPAFQRWESLASRIDRPVYRDQVQPQWINEAKGLFWYRTRVGEQQFRFVLVDALAGTRREFENRDQLATQISTANKEALVDGKTDSLIPNRRIQRSRNGGERTDIVFKNQRKESLSYQWVTADGNFVAYGKVGAGETATISTFDGHSWVLVTETGQTVGAFVAATFQSTAVIDDATPVPAPIERSNRRRQGKRNRQSPDGRWQVEFENDNVVLVDSESKERTTLSTDATKSNGYGGSVWWSPDSKHFVAMKTRRVEKRTISIVQSSPQDSIHSKLLTFNYAKPGDPVNHARPVLFDVEGKTARIIDDSLFPNPYSIGDLHWHSDSSFFSFVYNQRGHQALTVIAVDAESATPRAMIDEQSDTFVCYSHKQFLRRLDESDEAIWMSERSGWNHLYLIEQRSGEVKNAITSGEWVVRGVERVDVESRQIWLTVSGIDPQQDAYHQHLIRVNFDGTNLVRLTTGDGDHQWEFSPNGQFLVDTYSRVDLPPITELRDAKSGDLICELERADASALLATGWRFPERFVAKGRDGITDIYGIIIRPTNFDAAKTYPVLEAIYAGPQAAFVPKRFGRQTGLQKMAELGFIVVKIDGMGTSYRSKAFHDVCWKNLGDSGFPDRINWIKAAAAERPEMDLSRVGIWGGSAGGQSAMRALIAHGDFYHAAAADCGCHDNRVDKIWWNEQWMGYPVGDHYAEQSNVTQAHRLQGSLMLIAGELDRNVDPASTMQVVDALVKANKRFELLLMPGVGHGAAGHPYAERRQAEFFVEKLQAN